MLLSTSPSPLDKSSSRSAHCKEIIRLTGYDFEISPKALALYKSSDATSFGAVLIRLTVSTSSPPSQLLCPKWPAPEFIFYRKIHMRHKVRLIRTELVLIPNIINSLLISCHPTPRH